MISYPKEYVEYAKRIIKYDLEGNVDNVRIEIDSLAILLGKELPQSLKNI